MIVGPFGFLMIDVEVILWWGSVMQRLRVITVCSQYKLQVTGVIIAVKLTESNPIE